MNNGVSLLRADYKTGNCWGKNNFLLKTFLQSVIVIFVGGKTLNQHFQCHMYIDFSIVSHETKELKMSDFQLQFTDGEYFIVTDQSTGQLVLAIHEDKIPNLFGVWSHYGASRCDAVVPFLRPDEDQE